MMTAFYLFFSIPATRRMHVGKELEQFESIDLYDNGARFYDPLLMRFTTPDPLALSYPSLSPFAYCANNPVNRVDLDGMRILKAQENTEAENAEIDIFIGMASNSEIFTTMYKEMDASTESDFIFKYKEIDFQGLYSNREIAYKRADNMDMPTFVEEFVHAYQDFIGLMSDESINKEYEAKLITNAITGTGNGNDLSNEYNRDTPLLHNLLSNIYLDGTNVQIPICDYINAGGEFVKFHTREGNVGNYTVPVTSFSKMIDKFLNIIK